MGKFVDLEGVRGGSITPRGKFMARTVTGFMVILRTGRVCSTAGDHGAVTVWRMDNGAYRCDFSRYCATIGSATCETKAEVRRWLKDWLPKIDQQPGE